MKKPSKSKKVSTKSKCQCDHCDIMPGGATSELVRFYRDGAALAGGKSLADILKLEDARLEDCHDYVQWLFPIPEKSMFNPWAPALTAADQKVMREDLTIQVRLLSACQRLMAFLGFNIVWDTNGFDPKCFDPIYIPKIQRIQQADNFPTQFSRWAYPNNHNHYRITRILRCLSLLGQKPAAKAFFKTLSDLNAGDSKGKISAETFEFWKKAIK